MEQLSRPFKQRSSVLLPEPLLPMMAITTWPRLDVQIDAFEHLQLLPKRLRRARDLHDRLFSAHDGGFLSKTPSERRTAESKSQSTAPPRRRRPKRAWKVALLTIAAGLGEFNKTNHRGERRALDHLHEQSPRWAARRCAKACGQDDVAHAARRKLSARLERAASHCPRWHGVATQPRQISDKKALRCRERERQAAAASQAGTFKAQQSQAEVGQKQLHQQRRALEDLHKGVEQAGLGARAAWPQARAPAGRTATSKPPPMKATSESNTVQRAANNRLRKISQRVNSTMVRPWLSGSCAN